MRLRNPLCQEFRNDAYLENFLFAIFDLRLKPGTGWMSLIVNRKSSIDN